MPERIRASLTYANVVATAALALALAGSVMVAENMINNQAAGSSAGATWFLAGSESELPSCSTCQVSLPVSGTGFFGSLQNTANDQLSPNVTVIASDFSVHVDTAPGIAASGAVATRTFALFFRSDPSHSLKCDISGSNTTGNSGGQTLTIPPRSLLLVDAANSGNAPPTKVQFSWKATPQ